MNKVIIETQVLEFIQRQAPETRKNIREALRSVEAGQRFPEPLDDELDGFYKLKIDRIRLIMQPGTSEDGPVLKVVFAEKRKVVYEIFSQILGLE